MSTSTSQDFSGNLIHSIIAAPPTFAVSRCSRFTLGFALTLLCWSGSFHGQSLWADEVDLIDRAGHRVTRTGTILRYNRNQLEYESPSGVVSRVPAERVVNIRAEYLESHQTGLRLYRDRKLDEALHQFRRAYAQEQRLWVRERLVARTIPCFFELGERRRAIATFLKLLARDPATRFRYTIPIPWRPAQAAPEFQREARTWLDDPRQTPAAKLIGASWLLSGRDREAAEQTLRSLQSSRTRSSGQAAATADWIAQLAEAQLWRRRAVTVEADELEGWQTHFERLSDDLKSGPAFMLAQGLARQRQLEAAVLCYLQVAWRQPARQDLAGDALWAASQLLQRIGRDDEAKSVLDELVADYPDSPFASQAVDQLDRL